MHIYWLTYHSTEQIHSWEINRFSASQGIHRILWDPKVNYRIHKRPPPVRNLTQFDPVHIPTSHFPRIHLNIILSSMPGSSKWSFSLRFAPRNCINLSSPPFVFNNINYGNCTHGGKSIRLHCRYKCTIAKLVTLLGDSNVVFFRTLLVSIM